MELIASGIFMWSASERRGRRYGYIYNADTNYNSDVKVEPKTLVDVMSKFEGKRVRFIAKVIENRQSGHAGDLFCYPRMFPVMPEAGEEIVVGIGTFSTTSDPDTVAGSADNIAFGVIPSDGRDYFWIDPRVIYRLHDQTVELYVEETTEADLPLSDVVDEAVEGKVISNGDGSFQVVGKKIPKEMKLAKKLTRLGEGCFMLSNDYQQGEEIEVLDTSGDLSQATDE